MRKSLRSTAQRTALQKRQDGMPTYSVPEAAALLSISPEYLYRLIQADAFPAVRLSIGGRQGRYIVPAVVVEQLLNDAAVDSSCVDIETWTRQWNARRA